MIMKNVLVAMDFSDESVNALNYAMSSCANANIHVLHITQGVLQETHPVGQPSAMTKEMLIQDEVVVFIKKALSLETIPDVMKIHIVDGEPVSALKKYVEHHNINVVYIGSREKYDAIDRWIGTTTLGVVKTSNLPVYVIPPGVVYDHYNKVLVASDSHVAHTEHLQNLKAWNELYNAYIKFLHVQTGDQDDYTEESQRIVTEMYEKAEPNFGFEVEVVKRSNVTKAVLDSADQFDTDLLMVISVKQSFIESLLFESTTKDLILQSKLPMLFIPNNAQ